MLKKRSGLTVIISEMLYQRSLVKLWDRCQNWVMSYDESYLIHTIHGVVHNIQSVMGMLNVYHDTEK